MKLANTKKVIKPPADVYEGSKDFIICVDLPGVNKDNLSVRFLDNSLTIEGTKNSLIYRRVFSTPEYINIDKIHAKLKNGIFTLNVPKPERSVSREICVSTD
jgi:HSP20 family molecular chaperone IbpA